MPRTPVWSGRPVRRWGPRAGLLGALAVAAMLAFSGGGAVVSGQTPPALDARSAAATGRLDQTVLARVEQGEATDAIVIYDDARIQAQASARRASAGLEQDDNRLLAQKARAIESVKSNVLAAVPAGGVEVVTDYEHFAVQHIRIHDAAALEALIKQPGVLAIHENKTYKPTLAQSLALIRQPAAASAGQTGTGTAVAVLDTGVNYTHAAFGCTAVATPASCKVAAAIDFAPNDGSLDAHGHGTNVAGIVVGVAPSTKILALDVFDGDTGYTSTIVSALNWVVSNKATYNTVAANMSLGDDSYWTAQCSTSAFASAFSSLRGAGILPVVAAGNGATGSSAVGVSDPACAPGAVSVGAVYDSNLGGVAFSSCTDTTTAADKITCFSQSAPFLSILAPGGAITAAGITMYGTSQATPHVAGAVAVLGGCRTLTAAQYVAGLTNAGPQITDTRNSVTVRRLDVMGALTLLGTCSSTPPSPTPGGAATATATTPPPPPGGTLAPMYVNGTVTVNGQPVPGGSTITALVGVTSCGSGTVTVGRGVTTYAMRVLSVSHMAGCATAGATVTFRMGSTPLNGSATFVGGATATVNLTGGTGTVGPTATATATTTATATSAALRPMTLSGTAVLKGSPAPAGVRVMAYVGSTICGAVLTTKSNLVTSYSITIDSSAQRAGCATNGSAMRLTVYGVTAAQTVTFVSGGVATLNLTAP